MNFRVKETVVLNESTVLGDYHHDSGSTLKIVRSVCKQNNQVKVLTAFGQTAWIEKHKLIKKCG